MERLIWHDADKWINALQGSQYTQHDTVMPYPFPMEEVLFRLLMQAKVGVAYESLDCLRMLWEEYRKGHADFDIAVEYLIEEGWIDCFCGRWALVRYIHETESEPTDGRIQKILAFLRWLQRERRVHSGGIYLEDWDEALNQLRELYPALPTLDWFIENHIAAEDRRHFESPTYAPYHSHLCRALIRLWFYGEFDHEQWMEMVSQLGLTARIFELMPYEERQEALAVIADRMLAGEVPAISAENQRILRHDMLETGKFRIETDRRKMLREGDTVSNLLYLEKWGWNSSAALFERSNFLLFEVMAAAEYLNDIPEQKLNAVLERLATLHERGMLLHLGGISSSACIRLLEYKGTQFLALHTLLIHHRQMSFNGNTSSVNCVSSWLRFALRRREFDNVDGICKLLLYLSEFSFRTEEGNRWESGLTREMLLELGRTAEKRHDFANILTKQLIETLDASSGLTWCRRFHLLCEWTQELTAAAHGTSSDELNMLYRYLLTQLGDLFDKKYNERATFILPEVFCLPFWPRLYELADSGRRYRLRDPVRRWLIDVTPTTQEMHNARYQLCLGLAWLTALAAAFETDSELNMALESFLAYTLTDDNRALYVVYRENAAVAKTIERAVHTLKVGENGDSPLFRLDVAGLLTVARYAKDEALRKKLLELAEAVPQEDIEDGFGWDQIVQDVLDQKAEALYGYCEDKLKEHIEACEEKGWTKHPAYRTSRRQLSHLWYLEERYDELFQNGDPWWKAVAHLADGRCQDLRYANQEWRQLARDTREPAAYLNWLLCYIRMLEDGTDSPDGRASIYREIERIRGEIETGLFARWPDGSRDDYGLELTYLKTLSGTDGDTALSLVIGELHLLNDDADRLRNKWRESQKNTEVFIQELAATPNADSCVINALRAFHGFQLMRKAACYLKSRDVPLSEEQDTALVFFEVLRTMYHLSIFGDKLLTVGKEKERQKLKEDHCTQLFREMFNHGTGEWWAISANDQQQSGTTGTIVDGRQGSAENDLVVRDHEYELMVLEALVLTYCDKKSLSSHLEKLIGDSRNCPMTLLIYGNSMNPIGLWERIKAFLNGEFLGTANSKHIQIEPFVSLREQKMFYHPYLYHGAIDELVDHTLATFASHKGGRQLPLFVLYADIGKRAHAEISKSARQHK